MYGSCTDQATSLLAQQKNWKEKILKCHTHTHEHAHTHIYVCDKKCEAHTNSKSLTFNHVTRLVIT